MNKKLFEYAFETMLQSGGDGNTVVLLKKQSVEDVAKEFEDWAKEKWGAVEKWTTPDGILFCDRQESIHFVQWKNFDKFQKNDSHKCPLTYAEYLFSDNIIITW